MTREQIAQMTTKDFDMIYNSKEFRNYVKVKSRLDLSYVREDLKEIWSQWLEFKVELKQPYKTSVGVKSAYRKLLRLSGGVFKEAENIIYQSIENEWTGLWYYKEQIKPEVIVNKKKSVFLN